MPNVWLDEHGDAGGPPAGTDARDPLDAVIERLAAAIDATGESEAHIRRMKLYATGLARAIRLTPDAVEDVRMAALLHDVGYLGIAQHILNKPGPLTEHEFAAVAAHPQIGVEILRSVPVRPEVLTSILGHHERWDGTGYPLRLQGDAIPVGARVLALVDCFDALTRNRPYREKVSAEAALAVLREESGKAFDPHLVRAFVDICPALLADLSAGVLDEAPGRDAIRQEAIRSIGLANREIHAIHRLTTRVGTTMSVASMMEAFAAELPELVPFDTCALFLPSADAGPLCCRWATGASAGEVRDSTVPSESIGGRPAESVLSTPLTVGEQPLGTLALYRTGSSPYTADHRRLLTRVGEPLAAVLHRTLAYERALNDTLTDPLTGLPSERFLWLHIKREMARARRLRIDVGLIVFELDTDPTQAARLVSGILRRYDLCVRLDDEILAVVLSGTGYREAVLKSAEIRRALEALPSGPNLRGRPREGVSSGVAIFPHDADSADELMEVARRRLASGRQPSDQPPLPLDAR